VVGIRGGFPCVFRNLRAVVEKVVGIRGGTWEKVVGIRGGFLKGGRNKGR